MRTAAALLRRGGGGSAVSTGVTAIASRLSAERKSVRRGGGGGGGRREAAAGAAAMTRCALLQPRRCLTSGFDKDASAPVPPPAFPRPTLEKPHVGKPDGRGGVIIGDPTAGIRDNLPYTYHRAQFIGRMHPLVRPRTDAGDVLALIDICTGRAAVAYLLAETNVLGTFRIIDGRSLATVSFNSFTFPQPVYEGDLIIIKSKVISTGVSSIAVYALVERQAYDSPVPSYVGEAYVTFVAIDANDITKPLRGIIPAVRLSLPEDIERSATYHMLRKQNKYAKDRSESAKQLSPHHGPVSIDEIETEENKRKSRKVRIRDTTILAHHHFSVADVNSNNAIFGGEILRVMERSALHCGRVFAGKSRLFTLAMLGMTFDAPMYLSDLARCRARVLCVKRSTLLVRVEIAAENENGRQVTNAADFILVAVTEKGTPFEIDCGIELVTAAPEELQWYARGRLLLEESAKNRVSVVEAKARAAQELLAKKESASDDLEGW